MDSAAHSARAPLDRQRWRLVCQLDRTLETPLAVLGFVWLALLVLELAGHESPFTRRASYAIWAVFLVDFLGRFALAPRKLGYLRRNWITALALAIPALRVLRWARMLRALRAARGLRLLRILTSVNRGMGSLRRSMARRGLGYVAALTAIVTFAGAAGMYAFENLPGGQGLSSYPEALWWTAMIMTTMGSEYWPQTAEGRVLALLLALYAFAVFGYVTAAVASLLVGRDQSSRYED